MAQPAIPISQIVEVIPSVVGTGGNPLALNAVFVTTNPITPTSSLLEFPTSDDTGDYYGTDSPEHKLSINYFLGFEGSTKKPSSLFFAGYASTGDTKGWLRGQSLAGMTLPQLKAITGTLSIYIDDDEYQAASIDLSAVTSFTEAATALATALGISAVATLVWDAMDSKFVVTSNTLGATSDVSFATGTAADALGLSSGVRTEGADEDTPASAMARIKDQSQNFASFMTIQNTTNDEKEGFAAWSNSQNKRYVYVAWDDAAGYSTPNNPAVFGTIVDTKNYDGTFVVYNTPAIAAFVCGYAASIDWDAFNGRATPAFKTQGGLATSVNKLPLANAVLSNNASYYGFYQAAGAGNIYSILYDGRMNGSPFRWLDTYLNQLFLNSQLRRAIFEGLLSVNSAPYNALGETLLRSWCADPIAQGLNNGSIRTGVALSNAQKSTIAQQAGLDISNELFGQGYYLQILPATAEARGGRRSPPCRLFYCDGGSIQSISLASTVIL